MQMPDTNTKNLDNAKQNEMRKKHSFFWWEINEKTKDLLDFRYNTQEEIDKLNDEMTTTNDLDDIIKQTNNNENNEDMNEENIKEKDEKDADSDLEGDLESVDESLDNDARNNNYDEIYEQMNKPIEWEIVENPDENKKYQDKTSDKNTIEELNDEDQEMEKNNEENESDWEENEEEVEDNTEDYEWDSSKFFDPFELNIDEDEEIIEWNDQWFDPFGLNEENFSEENNKKENDNSQNEENKEKKEFENENDNEEVKEDINNNEEQKKEEYESDDNTDIDENDEIEEENDEVDEEQNEKEVAEDTAATNAPVNVSTKDKEEKTIKDKKIKKNSATWEIITDKEIQLEQWQDIQNTENNEDYQPSAEELFEREPEFFANDELSQQFMHLVMNVRGIFKLERKDWEQNPYFKILWWKTEISTLEYLFYLIEEENEPIDLYIKKVETNQESEEEDEHLVQFSYNENKELNIFVDEIILYEKINKSNSENAEYNDTKSILEKFIFLTDNYYDKLKSELNKQHEEMQKKRQLQQIFKGF